MSLLGNLRKVGLARGLINSAVDPIKSTLTSTVTTMVTSLIIAGVIIFSLIQLFRQFENYVLQNFENGESILTLLYGLVVIVGLISLYIIFSGKGKKEKKLEKRIPDHPIDAIFTGLIDGFADGIRGQNAKQITPIRKGA